MTSTDWILDIALLLVVFRQIRESRVDRRFVIVPLAIVAVVAHSYLHDIPTAGNDIALVSVAVAVGAALGIAGGLATRVRSDGGRYALAKAGWIASALWVIGMGARMGFYLWSQHGGAPAIAQFSVAHHITTADAWVAAFVLMAMTEVATRLGTIVLRAQLAQRAAATPAGRSPALV